MMQKDEKLLEKRFIELSRTAYHQERITYSDFLNLNELNMLHSLPKHTLYTKYETFGGYDFAERQMAAFLPDALSFCDQKEEIFSGELCALEISPLNEKYAEELTHRDYLGAILNLGIDRCKTGDILCNGKDAFLFIRPQLKQFLIDELTRVRHTSVMAKEAALTEISYAPHYEEIKGTVASLRLDSLLSLAFSSSRTRLSGWIEGGNVFVNGRLITTNAFQVKENDIISVRGMGKFQYHERLSVTKKNRIYVSIYKYV